MGKVEATLQVVSGALQILGRPLAAAVVYEAGIVPNVAAQPGRCQLALKT